MATIEEWDETHPRWEELVQCVRDEHTQENPQMRWTFTAHPIGTPGIHFLVALQDGRVVGFLKFIEQEFGPDDDLPPFYKDGVALIEGKVTSFGVRAEFRNRGIGTALQEMALRRAGEVGCFQLRSHSELIKQANYAIKPKLGFAVQPDHRPTRPPGVFWVKRTG